MHVAVNRLSAVHRGSEGRFPINKDHSNLVKFSQNDPDYSILVSYLHEIASSFSSLDQAPPGDVKYETVSGSIIAPAGG